jgi:hypothetical protein
MFNLPAAIVLNQITFDVTTVTANGTIDWVIYAADGQSQLVSVTTASISTTGIKTVSVSGVSLAAGNYYLYWETNSTADITVTAWNDNVYSTTLFSTSGKATYEGTVAATTDTPPTTFTPSSSISAANQQMPVVRFDN